jgi:putative transposase
MVKGWNEDQVMGRGTPGEIGVWPLRMDHGTQYLSDYFQNQLKHWGINPSFAFIEQPQTNGVAERFIRTLKEQVIYGRVFQNLPEVREAVRRFIYTYNRDWLVDKNGFKSPWQARSQWLAQASLSRAA